MKMKVAGGGYEVQFRHKLFVVATDVYFVSVYTTNQKLFIHLHSERCLKIKRCRVFKRRTLILNSEKIKA